MPVLPSLLSIRTRMTVPMKSPDQISNLVLWLDANSGVFDATSEGNVVTTNGSSVARWEDQSGNGYHLIQNSATNRPILATGVRNNLNAIQYNGTTANLKTATALTHDLLAMTIFSVWNAFNSGGNGLGRVLDLGLLVNQPYTRAITWQAGPTRFQASVSTGISTLVNTPSYNLWNLHVVRWDGTTSPSTNPNWLTQKRSRALAATTNSGTNFSVSSCNGQIFSVGNRENNNGNFDRGWNGYISELIVYDSNLSNFEISAIENYLANKWAFT